MTESVVYDFREDIYFSPSNFLIRFYDDLSKCRESLDIEMYMLTEDKLTEQLEIRFAYLAERGVRVRLLVDAVGAYSWIKARKERVERMGIEVRVFHPLPGLQLLLKVVPQLNYLFRFINRRDHKKIIIIDQKIAFVGSFNLTQVALDWRETILRMTTPDVHFVQAQYESSWQEANTSISKILKRKANLFSLFNLNRRRYRQQFLRLLDNAKSRIWLTTPYFNPPRILLKMLITAAKRGVDVRLIVPERADVPYFEWIAQQYYAHLVQNNVKVYEYQKSVLHAKSFLVDDLAMVGSANLNFRSFFSDDEINVVAHKLSSLINLELQFRKDMSDSKQIDQGYSIPWFKKFVNYLILPFRKSL